MANDTESIQSVLDYTCGIIQNPSERHAVYLRNQEVPVAWALRRALYELGLVHREESLFAQELSTHGAPVFFLFKIPLR
ncbi:MAG: hypothetical protein OXR66_00650 [Candidatus Woesearchaeota archaeon]|nr:hypothetical protein [Candidatus Woesearchaeota archaeon]